MILEPTCRSVCPTGLTNLNGRFYTTDGNQEQILEVTREGQARQIIQYPKSNRALTGIIAGSDGALYVAEHAAMKVTRVTLDGQISDAATKVQWPIGIAFDPGGQLYVLEYYQGRLLRSAPVGRDQKDILVTGLHEPTALIAGPDGNLYIAVDGGKTSPEGEILRVRLVSEPSTGPAVDDLSLSLLWPLAVAGLGVVIGAVVVVLVLRRSQRTASRLD
jgi:hypothetical protein